MTFTPAEIYGNQLDEVLAAYEEAALRELRYAPSQRLLEAVAKGQVTRGGMAEAGWFDLGRISCDDELDRR